MLVKNESACPRLHATDGCLIRELLHPANDSVALPFSLAIAEVAPGTHSYRHRLAQTEVYYLLAGTGCMHIDGEQHVVGAGDAILIPPHAVQWIENTGPATLKFVAVVSPPWRSEDDERL